MPSKDNCSCHSSSDKKSTEEKRFDSVLLSQIIGINKELSEDIEHNISKNGHVLSLRIPEEFFPKIELVTNDDSNNNKLRLINVNILRDEDLKSLKRVTVPGLKEMFIKRILKTDIVAYKKGQKTYLPFAEDFNGTHIGDVIDDIVDIMGISKSTRNVKKIIELYFENGPTPCQVQGATSCQTAFGGITCCSV